ncbi:MAG: peptidoglycan DD-metalloendopeptidase family protein, partial [Rhodomicrobium sp.]
QGPQGAQGPRMADGYGPYNRPPVADGTYAGPRVYTPYDQPGDAPPPAQNPPYDLPRYEGQYSPSTPPYSRSSGPGYGSGNDVHVYVPEPPRGYGAEPQPGPGYERNYRDGPRGDEYYRGPSGDPRGRQVVRVVPGDTLYSLARRYGVTVDMIARANGLSSLNVRPGMELIIPRADPASYGQSQTASPVRPASCNGERCHVVTPGETMQSLAQTYGVPEYEIAQANGLPVKTPLKLGQPIFIPLADRPNRHELASNGQGHDRDAAPPVRPGGSIALASPPGKDAKTSSIQTVEPLKPVPSVRTADAKPAAEPACEAALANPMPRMGSTFRRPVEGKTIAQYGPQKDGTINEGITISVPKGTPIKAAENGVVAYVGDELPGFGNLILIRHADEYVTAYAHADAILVKKCDVVKRGQTVATAGTTGDASQPELHFEIRKNSKPVDPAPLLGS